MSLNEQLRRIHAHSHLLPEFIQHPSTDGCCVGPEDVLLGFFDLPVILVTMATIKSHDTSTHHLPSGPISSCLVHSLDSVQIVHWKLMRQFRVYWYKG